MKQLWKGQYLDGKTSAPRKVGVRLLKGGVRIQPARGRAQVWPYSEIRQAQGYYAGEPVRLERGDEITEVLTLADTEFLNRLRTQARGQAGRFHNPHFRRARWWLTLYAGLATLVVGFVAYRWGIPALAERVASRVPVSWEEGLGKSTLDQLVPADTRLQDPTLNSSIVKIVARLTGTLSHCPYHFRVTLCDRPIVNAFALPGGEIVVFRGLLEETRAPEELAGVLAHEIQHVLKRHTTRRLIQESSMGLLISAMSGDLTGSMAFGVKSASTLALLKYSREEEEEADREGMKMILAAGIDAQGMLRFFKTLQAHEKLPQFLEYVSTHPATGERLEKLKGIVSAQDSQGGKALGGKVTVRATQASKPEKLLPGIAWPALVKGLRPTK